jgi:hypothetical protein
VPAFRSRTLHWRRSLDQLAGRGGTLEIAIAPAGAGGADAEGVVSADLVWKLRIHRMSDSWIDLEAPELLHRVVPMPAGVTVFGAIVVGPNRWLFRTECLGPGGPSSISGRPIRTIRIAMPDEVSRTRRTHLRVEAASLSLPQIRVWPLLDKDSVRPMQRLLAIAAQRLDAGESLESREWDSESVRPTLGPEFSATLMNLGGGGAGLRVAPEFAGLLARHQRFWIELDLRPESILPLCATARIAHTHLEAGGATYAGIAFDFTADAEHSGLVARQVLGAIATRQSRQRRLSEDSLRAA